MRRRAGRLRSACVVMASAIAFGMMLSPMQAAAVPALPAIPQLLVASDRAADDWGGEAVAVSGDWALFGAPYAGPAGAAYVMTRSGTGWAVVQRLTVPNGSLDEEFGRSVAISGDTLVVGAPGFAARRGEAYVFVRSGLRWVYQATLLATGGVLEDEFGRSVSISGNTVLVGAPGRSGARGRVFVFTRSGSTWSQQAEIWASDQAANDRFGWSVSVSGDTALIGSPWDDTTSSDGGAAYVFTRSGSAWTQRIQIESTTSDAGDQFGRAVALCSGTAVIGAPMDDETTATDSGAAHVYTGSGATWTFQQRLTAGSPGNAGLFGWSVATDGDLAVVGEMQSDEFGTLSGAGHLFWRSVGVWNSGGVLGHASMTSYNNIGYGVGISGTTAVVGAPRDSSYAGAVYVFHGPKNVVHRFYAPGAGTHFYTDSAVEAVSVTQALSHIYQYEGIAYTLDPARNTQVLYRFYKPSSSSHFYTASLAERNHVMATWPHIYSYEGQTYAVTPVADAVKRPVYRFYNMQNGSHFYTVSAAEKAHVQATWPHIYHYEGAVFWIGQ